MIKLSINLNLSCSKILLCLACGVSVAVCANYICSANKNNRYCQKNQKSLNPVVKMTQTKDENHRASSEEKEALMEIISENETFFKNILCFKHILENFESNHKYFGNGTSLMENNKLKKNNLLNFAKQEKSVLTKAMTFPR